MYIFRVKPTLSVICSLAPFHLLHFEFYLFLDKMKKVIKAFVTISFLIYSNPIARGYFLRVVSCKNECSGNIEQQRKLYNDYKVVQIILLQSYKLDKYVHWKFSYKYCCLYNNSLSHNFKVIHF